MDYDYIPPPTTDDISILLERVKEMNTSTSTTDMELNLNALIQTIYTQWKRKMFGYAYNRLKDEELAANAVHDTLMELFKILKKNNKYFENTSHLLNCTFFILRNKLSDIWEENKEWLTGVVVATNEEILEYGTLLSEVDDGNMSELIRKLYREQYINKLSPEDAELIRLYYIEGYDAKYLSERYHITQAAFTKRRQRIITNLRKILKNTEF